MQPLHQPHRCCTRPSRVPTARAVLLLPGVLASPPSPLADPPASTAPPASTQHPRRTAQHAHPTQVQPRPRPRARVPLFSSRERHPAGNSARLDAGPAHDGPGPRRGGHSASGRRVPCAARCAQAAPARRGVRAAARACRRSPSSSSCAPRRVARQLLAPALGQPGTATTASPAAAQQQRPSRPSHPPQLHRACAPRFALVLLRRADSGSRRTLDPHRRSVGHEPRDPAPGLCPRRRLLARGPRALPAAREPDPRARRRRVSRRRRAGRLVIVGGDGSSAGPCARAPSVPRRLRAAVLGGGDPSRARRPRHGRRRHARVAHPPLVVLLGRTRTRAVPVPVPGERAAPLAAAHGRPDARPQPAARRRVALRLGAGGLGCARLGVAGRRRTRSSRRRRAGLGAGLHRPARRAAQARTRPAAPAAPRAAARGVRRVHDARPRHGRRGRDGRARVGARQRRRVGRAVPVGGRRRPPAAAAAAARRRARAARRAGQLRGWLERERRRGARRGAPQRV